MSKQLDYPPTKIDVAEAIKFRYCNRLSYQEIADRYGVSRQAVQERLSNVLKHLPDIDDINAYTVNKVQLLNGLEFKLVQKMLDTKTIKESSLNNAAYAFQQVATQNRLEKGLATNIVDTFSLTDTVTDYRKRRLEMLRQVAIKVQDVVLSSVPDVSVITPEVLSDGKQDS